MGSHRVDIDPEDGASALMALAGLLAAAVDPLAVDWCEIGDLQADLFDRPGASDGAPASAVGAAQAAQAVPSAAGRRPASTRRAPLPSRSVAPSTPSTQSSRPTPWPAGLPTGFIELARLVAMHRDRDRFVRLHLLARRLLADRRAWLDELDPALLQLRQMAREVRREIHKMHAFVRFRPLQEAHGTRHIAWFEPHHAVVRAAAPFFARRFAAMHWSILTPRLSVDWDRQQLRFGPGADRQQAPAPDAGEALWIAYYRSIFNPARLNPAAMKREMPRRYWSNLPEAAAIPSLIREAPARSVRMQAHASTTLRRLPAGTASAATSSAVSPGPSSVVYPAGSSTGSSVSSGGLPAAARLKALAGQARYCSDCPMAASATQTVWGDGEIGATLMLVGEQPGDHEDLANRPFVGPAGQLLRRALARLDWPLSALYLTNAVKHFRFELRGKRRIHKTPGQREVLACSQWLEAEIGLVRPRAIVALGSTAASSLLGRPVSVRDSAGRVYWRDDGIAVHVVHHPAAILRRAESGAPSFDDWVAALAPAWPTMAAETARADASEASGPLSMPMTVPTSIPGR